MRIGFYGDKNMKNEECELFQIIPREETNRVFKESSTASVDMDFSF